MAFDTVGIACKDLQATAEFYRLLGVQLQPISQDHFEAITPSGVRIMADSFALMRKLDANWQPPHTSGITLGFCQPRPSDVDALFTTIVEAGFVAKAAPWDAFWGQRYATVHDPDGNPVDIYADLPDSSPSNLSKP